MAALEYEVRDEYRDYTVAQLLDAPVTCFQGVGDIQREMLDRYFGVGTVRDLAHLDPFVQALSIQETVLEGGDFLGQTVADAGPGRQFDFRIRPTDQSKRVLELPDAPVHVLEGLTPGQDLALYDAFRITNLTHLAHNRIMLEARVIDYLAEHGEDVASPEAGQQAVASILGARAATSAAGQARARSSEFAEGGRLQELAGQMNDHVRDRVQALRSRTAAGVPRPGATEGRGAGAPAGLGRVDTIRESRERGRPAARGAEQPARPSSMRSRADDILASRSAGGMPQQVAQSVSHRRAGEIPSPPSGAPSRVASVTTARQAAGRGGPPQGAMVRTRAPAGAAAQAAGAGAGAAGAGAEAAAGAEAGAAGLGREERAAAAARRPARPNVLPLAAVAVVALLVLGGLIYFLVTRGAPEEAGSEGTAGIEQTAPGTTGTETEGAQESTTGTAGAPAIAGTTTGPPTSPPPPRVKGVHIVSRGDTLWWISDREYADPFNWPSIFMENQEQITHPDLIFPAQDFRIPSSPEFRFPDHPKGYRRVR